MTSAHGDRGKAAEKALHDALDVWNSKHISFAYERLPDARSAGGRFKACICDFLIWWKPNFPLPGQPERVSIQLEVKETKHDFRISKDKIRQLARMRRVELAGGKGFILIYHSGLDQWRIAPVSFFVGEGVTSWNLAELALYDTAAEALVSTGMFPS